MSTALEKATPERKGSADWAPAFLAMLANSANVRLSCKEAGVDRRVAYRRRDSDPDFRQAWDDALEDACDLLEACARKRAMEYDTTLTIFLLKSHRRHVYGDRLDVTIAARREAQRIADEYGIPVEDVLRQAERIVNRG